jgi:hypothetical protein
VDDTLTTFICSYFLNAALRTVGFSVLARKSFDLKGKRYLFANGCSSDPSSKPRNSGSSQHFAVGIMFAPPIIG